MPAARPPMYLDQGPADDRGPAPQQAVEAVLYASQGVPGFGRQILYTDYSHDANYAVVVRNHAGAGLALQVQASDGTDRLLVNNSGIQVVGAISTTGNISADTLNTTGDVVVAGNILTDTLNTTGNVEVAGNILTDTLTATDNIATDTLTATGDISADILTVTGVVATALAVTSAVSFFGVGLSAQADAWTQTYTDIQRVIGPLVSTTPAAFSGIASGLGGSPYASVINLNDLRSEFGLIRADLHDVKKNFNSLLNDQRGYGLEPV